MLKKFFSSKSSENNDSMNNKGGTEEILAEYMLKRSVNKSTLFSNENYKERWFVLDGESLKYYDGSLGVSSHHLIYKITQPCGNFKLYYLTMGKSVVKN